MIKNLDEIFTQFSSIVEERSQLEFLASAKKTLYDKNLTQEEKTRVFLQLLPEFYEIINFLYFDNVKRLPSGIFTLPAEAFF